MDRVTSLTSSKTNKNVVKDSKKPNVSSSISKVSTPKRPKFYDDQFDKREKEESKRITSPNKIMKNKTPNKMMKKSPAKKMHKGGMKMMKKSPTMMMKKSPSKKMMKAPMKKMMKKKK